MNYREEKMRAMDMANKMVETGKFTSEDIGFYVMKSLGFGQKTIIEYINQSVIRGLFVIEKKTGCVRLPEKKED